MTRLQKDVIGAAIRKMDDPTISPETYERFQIHLDMVTEMIESSPESYFRDYLLLMDGKGINRGRDIHIMTEKFFDFCRQYPKANFRLIFMN